MEKQERQVKFELTKNEAYFIRGVLLDFATDSVFMRTLLITDPDKNVRFANQILDLVTRLEDNIKRDTAITGDSPKPTL